MINQIRKALSAGYPARRAPRSPMAVVVEMMPQGMAVNVCRMCIRPIVGGPVGVGALELVGMGVGFNTVAAFGAGVMPMSGVRVHASPVW
jgi:hypothetical protein